MGESWLSVLLVATLTTMTMTAMTKADPFSTPSTITRDDIVDSKLVCFQSLFHTTLVIFLSFGIVIFFFLLS